MKLIRAFFMCLGMFTALPCPYRPWDEKARGLMTSCLPAVGLVVGALWYGLSLAGRALLPEALAAALTAALPLLLTGLIHLDGFMDTADALLSWRPLEKRHEILKDVHCGSFSVAAAILLAMFQFAAASDALPGDLRPLIFIPVASRCMSAACVSTLRPIGHSEYATMKRGRATPAAACAVFALALLTGGLLVGGGCAVCIAATAVGYALAMAWAYRTMQGVSGDLAGFSLCAGELCGLIALAIV